jgi:Flp pilus assembly protein TadG
MLGSEDGAVVVVFAVFAPVAILLAAFAIDTGGWFLHKRHLQLQADAGALAAAQAFQPCANESIYKLAGQYGGVTSVSTPQGSVTSSTPLYNVQAGKTSGSNTHAVINSKSYFGRSALVDSSASAQPPCTPNAQMVDVKMTETDVPWYWRALSSVPYIDAHARVEILQATSVAGAEPFAEPLPTPNTLTATLWDESKNAALTAPVTLTPSADHTTWTTTGGLPVTFSNSASGSFPVGLRIAMTGAGSAATCGGGVTCYDNSGSTPKIGIAYTRVWSNSGTPGLPLSAPAAPQASDVALEPTGSSPCPSSGAGVFSNFISSEKSCTVALSAKMAFTSTGGTSLSCTTAALTLTAGANTITIPCPGTPNGTWTSAAATVPANAGSLNFTLGWRLTAGNKPPGSSGGSGSTCTTTVPCTATFGVVQRAYSGAHDSLSVEAAAKRSGPILEATVIDPGGRQVMSVSRGTSENVNITVKVLGFQNSTTIPSAPVELAFGGNQANGALECGGNAGVPALEKALREGCAERYGTTSAPAAEACLGAPTPPVCATENPGNGKLDKVLDGAMNQRINGGANKCVNPNRWAAPNTVSQIATQSPKDPRLIITMITDNGALSNGSNKIPIRAFATFYVTGWAGDPCIGVKPGTSNGLAYTGDDDPGSENKGVLLGHFIKYIDTVGTKETGSGPCNEQLLDRCVAVLTR